MNKGLLLIEHQPYSAIDRIWFTSYDSALLFIAIITFFYFLYNRRTWLMNFSLICLLLFNLSVAFQKIKSNQTNGIIFYSLSKHTGILFKNGDQGILLSDLKPADLNFKYSIQPAIDSNRIEDLKNVGLNANVETAYLKKRSSLIQFRNKRLLIYDPHLEYVKQPRRITVDYLYLTGNPHTPLRYINQNYTYKNLIIDGTNSTPNIKRIVNQADSLHINYIVLRRNKSVVVRSN